MPRLQHRVARTFLSLYLLSNTQDFTEVNAEPILQLLCSTLLIRGVTDAWKMECYSLQEGVIFIVPLLLVTSLLDFSAQIDRINQIKAYAYAEKAF